MENSKELRGQSGKASHSGKRARWLSGGVEAVPALGFPGKKAAQTRVETQAQDSAETGGCSDAPGRGTKRLMRRAVYLPTRLAYPLPAVRPPVLTKTSIVFEELNDRNH